MNTGQADHAPGSTAKIYNSIPCSRIETILTSTTTRANVGRGLSNRFYSLLMVMQHLPA